MISSALVVTHASHGLCAYLLPCEGKGFDACGSLHSLLWHLSVPANVGDTDTRGWDLVVNLQHQQHTAVPLSVIGQLVWRQASHKKQSRFSVDPAGQESQLAHVTHTAHSSLSLVSHAHLQLLTLSSNWQHHANGSVQA